MFRATPIFRSYKCTLQTIGVCTLWKTELNIIKLCGAMCGGDCAFVVVWFFWIGSALVVGGFMLGVMCVFLYFCTYSFDVLFHWIRYW